MFEAELEMERKSSSFGPVLFIALLVGVIAGGIFYVVHETRKAMTEPEATQLVNAILKSKGAATLHFRTGYVVQNVEEKPFDPHYKLLEKAGLIKTAKKGIGLQVVLTPAGEQVLGSIKGVSRTKRSEGGEAIVVPLAERKLVAITKLNVVTPSKAVVDYTWKWDPNKLGDVFDASSKLVETFNVWDRQTLIKDYGVDFYHADPKPEEFTFLRGNTGWSIAEAE